jgi:hypothetical protein
MAIVNGKKPLSQKPRPTAIRADDIFGNPLSLPADLKAAADKAGLSLRYVDYQKMVQYGGYHEKGWQVLKAEHLGCDKMELPYFNSPDATVRRGSLVLAFRTKEINERHKAFLRQEARRYDNIQKTHAEDLRRELDEAGVGGSVSIDEGND